MRKKRFLIICMIFMLLDVQLFTNTVIAAEKGTISHEEKGIKDEINDDIKNELDEENILDGENNDEADLQENSEALSSMTDQEIKPEEHISLDNIDENDKNDSNEEEQIEENVDESDSKNEESKIKEQEDTLQNDTEEGNANSWRYSNNEKLILDSPINVLGDFTPWSKVNGYFVNNKGEVIQGATKKGIDVSQWQGVIDWAKVKKTDVEFVIIRCGYGQNIQSQDDVYWKRNADECTRLGIPFGVYLYSYADTIEKAKSEAEHVLRLVDGYELSYPIYYDLEENNVRESVSKEEIGNIAKVFCDTIRQAGYDVGVYANTDWYTNYLTSSVFDNYDKWIAQYNSKCTYTKDYSIWQCTDSGSVDGISGYVDLNMEFEETESTIPRIVQEGNQIYGYLGNEKLYGPQKIENYWYYFDRNKEGAALKGWREIEGGMYYYDESGHLLQNKAKKIGSYYYYFKSNGLMLKGWREIGGGMYYYDESGHLLQNKAKKIDSYYYYFKSNGLMLKGWREIGGGMYYYDESGHLLQNKAKKIDSYYYYFKSNGLMLKGWREIGGGMYYYDESGHLLQNKAKKIGSYYYYFKSNGLMQKGWLEKEDNKYYYDNEGRMVTGEQKIGDAWYAFDLNDGRMIVNDWFNNHYYGEDGKRQNK